VFTKYASQDGEYNNRLGPNVLWEVKLINGLDIFNIAPTTCVQS